MPIPKRRAAKQILFEDDFTGEVLDPIWKPRGTLQIPGKMSRARADMRAVTVSDSRVHLSTILDPDQPTIEIEGTTYPNYLNGHIYIDQWFEPPLMVAARIRFQEFHGSHAAVWLQGKGYGVGEMEIDIAEHFGAHNPLRKTGVNMWSNLYWKTAEQQTTDEYSEDRAFVTSAEWNPLGRPWYEREHTFKARWREDGSVRTYIDGRVMADLVGNGSTTPKFPVLSILTRDYEADEQDHHPLPSTMSVDWIQIWRP